MRAYDLIVIGGGAAGMSAAISSYDSGVRNILIIERENELGGILNQCIHLGFGLHYFKEEMSGPTYANRLKKEIEKRPEIEVSLNSFVLDINSDKEVLVSTLEQKAWLKAKAIVLGVGSYERHASMIRLPGKRLNGIYNAGVAQKYMNVYGSLVGKKVFILGSGDIGLIMARRMTLEGAEVIGVAELMSYSNGLMRNIVTCLEDFDIPLYLSHTVIETCGDQNLESITIAEVDDKFQPISGTEKQFACDTLLLAVGLIPVTELMEKLDLDLDPRTKSVVIDSTYQTSIPGIFVCGNSLHVHDLVDYVSKESEIVGKYVGKYLHGAMVAEQHLVEICEGDNVGYVMPQSLNLANSDKSVELFFRVKKPMSDCQVVITVDDVEVRSIKKQILLPAEMESVRLSLAKVDADSKQIKVFVKE
ncbi:FAD-dependent oxidoreductase [Mollicutes bacterium LVI A0039]|nr:FAD-dependent oxidoreductase [Mollicutes bacterium LVI A0039]